MKWKISATAYNKPVVLCVVFQAGVKVDAVTVVVSLRGGGCVSVLDAPSGATAERGTLVLDDPDTCVATLLVVVVVMGGPSRVLGDFCGGGGRRVADLPVLHTLGWEVISHGGLGRLVVVVDDAAMMLKVKFLPIND